MKLLVTIFIISFCWIASANAYWTTDLANDVSRKEHIAHNHHYKHHVHHYKHHVNENIVSSESRPHAWCGWYMAHKLGIGGKLGRELWVARNWAHIGRPAIAAVGAIVVWAHHVGQIVGKATDGRWLINSGNDGHTVRTRPRSLNGVIAIREL